MEKNPEGSLWMRSQVVLGFCAKILLIRRQTPHPIHAVVGGVVDSGGVTVGEV